jgi:hypothetical protein
MRWSGRIRLLGEKRNEHKICVRTSEGETPHGKPRRRFENNIRMEVKETGLECLNGFIWLRIGTSGELLRI